MSDHLVPPQVTAPLRQQAEQQLRTGTAQFNTTFTTSGEALGVLYRLSSAAHTASDGLKLLHELQTYQVELDLQLEQLQQNERETCHELLCYHQFFAMAPVGYIMLSLDGLITDANPAAERLFAPIAQPQPPAQPLTGCSLLSLLSAACQPMYHAALARVHRTQQSTTLLITKAAHLVNASATDATTLRLTINPSSDHKAILVMLTNETAKAPVLQSSAESF